MADVQPQTTGTANDVKPPTTGTAEELTPQQKFLLLFKSQGIAIPDSFDTLAPPALMAELTKLVIPLEGQKLMVLAMLLLNGPYRKALPVDLIRSINDKLVAVIYERMPHPPRNLAAQDFRSVDGADRLGAAYMPYAQSVIPGPTSKLAYPSSQEVVNNPDGLSSLTFAYGTLVIHSVFRSGMTNPKLNETSSFFDLSPLYGDDIEEQLSVRNRTGKGLLAPDCFVDDRMLFLPPAAAALLVVFNRNHNYIAGELLKNEKEARNWTDPSLLQWDTLKRNKQDDEIFELARLVNCVHFVNIVITDYVGGVMGRTRDGGGWPLNASIFDVINLPDRAITFANLKNPLPDAVPKPTHVSRGDGNLVSIEFNTLYRWHATLSERDVKWAEDMIGDALNRRDFENLTPEDYIRAFRMAEPAHQDPKQRTFAKLVRDPETNFFNDNELATLIFSATEAPAGMFRANGTPLIMGFIDVRGIDRARQMGTCTMNEFRHWLGLPKYTSFEDWNKNSKISTAASELYGGDIDRLELYPGLHAEGVLGDGLHDYSGEPLRVNTMRNGLLLDAVALIRGDRFFTTAFNEENYTATGFADVQKDTTNKAYGGCVHKLLMRALPKNFPEDSVYTWFPMTTPAEMQKVLPADGWVFDRPTLPAAK
ncbi:heme peroxidase [Athelia psychrophila]|uniref:Heme peroxidase n=1 Tax=Athelia psychrophila TaxID=1759441 RepID=A0A166HXG5_9AGAM|nr:heme peroxidase [Fibularhizoctonia sp. CBS 109695]